MEAKILATLLKKIHNHFPGDIGCFCIYFFNYLVLKPGEALYLDAGEPHAYIFGGWFRVLRFKMLQKRQGKSVEKFTLLGPGIRWER